MCEFLQLQLEAAFNDAWALKVASYHFKVSCANDIAPILPRKHVYCYQIEVFVVIQHGNGRLIKTHVTYFIEHGT